MGGGACDASGSPGATCIALGNSLHFVRLTKFQLLRIVWKTVFYAAHLCRYCTNPHKTRNRTMAHDDTDLLVSGSTGLMACVAYCPGLPSSVPSSQNRRGFARRYQLEHLDWSGHPTERRPIATRGGDVGHTSHQTSRPRYQKIGVIMGPTV